MFLRDTVNHEKSLYASPTTAAGELFGADERTSMKRLRLPIPFFDGYSLAPRNPSITSREGVFPYQQAKFHKRKIIGRMHPQPKIQPN
jgi:hypothetical protein